MTSVHRDTIMRLMLRVGVSCEALMDDTMRNLSCQHIQVDEIWGYIAKKQRHIREGEDSRGIGDVWTFVALDADTKLMPVYRVGKRNALTANAFIKDLSLRLSNRVQLSSDALKEYVEACERAFGGDVDYGQIVKTYESEPVGAGRYSPPHVVAVDRRRINGRPKHTKISTSHIERQNLTMRMQCRRLTRLTNAFSKKLDNFKAAMALHFAHYNLVRIHNTLRVTPAMAAGVTDELWSVSQLLGVAGE